MIRDIKFINKSVTLNSNWFENWLWSWKLIYLYTSISVNKFSGETIPRHRHRIFFRSHFHGTGAEQFNLSLYYIHWLMTELYSFNQQKSLWCYWHIESWMEFPGIREAGSKKEKYRIRLTSCESHSFWLLMICTYGQEINSLTGGKIIWLISFILEIKCTEKLKYHNKYSFGWKSKFIWLNFGCLTDSFLLKKNDNEAISIHGTFDYINVWQI